MGTKLQHAINPLANSQNKNNSFAANRLDDWDYLQNKGLKENLQSVALDKLHYSMDRMLEQHNLESIKKTMLMHEDIFKQQVRELHRLYSAQKMLMDEMKNGIKQDRYWGPMTASDINHSHILEQHQPTNTTGYNLHFQSVRDSPRSREQQSVSCSGEFSRTPKGFDLETLAKEDIATGISKTSVDECDEESDVELTLSIGCSSGQKRSKSHQPHCSPDLSCTAMTHSKFRELGSSALSKSEEDNTMGSSSASLNQQSKQPHWLFQGLTLNRT